MKKLLMLKLFFTLFSTRVKDGIAYLFKNPKLGIAAVCLCVALFGGYEAFHYFDKVKMENAALVQQQEQLQKEKTQLKLDIDSAVEANVANQGVIEKLTIAANNTDTEKKQLIELQSKSKKDIQIIRQTIFVSKPEDDGPVANVLKSTIDSIQKNREAN
jgi:hypothetical protein